jgi:tRNA 2-thiouridine synthesizing protein D
MTDKTLTFALMDPPYENARSTTALRLIDIAIRKGYGVNVFAYEGAVYLPFARQQPHPNPVHGHSEIEEEDHPLPREWVSALIEAAGRKGVRFDWVNCGLCVDERGADESVAGVRRGTPGDFWAMAEASDNTLVIPTR